jgi:hypothetical protein
VGRSFDRLLAHTGPRPYASPYLAGIGVGLALLLAFVIVGRGLGASGAFTSVVAAGAQGAAPAHAAKNSFFNAFTSEGTRGPFTDWLVVEIIGVTIGGLLSGVLAGRFRRTTERGPRIASGSRLALAFGGGAIMGFGAMLARGCTSGLALTGGALLGVGAWIFIAAAFAAAFVAAPLFRRQWT